MPNDHCQRNRISQKLVLIARVVSHVVVYRDVVQPRPDAQAQKAVDVRFLRPPGLVVGQGRPQLGQPLIENLLQDRGTGQGLAVEIHLAVGSASGHEDIVGLDVRSGALQGLGHPDLGHCVGDLVGRGRGLGGRRELRGCRSGRGKDGNQKDESAESHDVSSLPDTANLSAGMIIWPKTVVKMSGDRV